MRALALIALCACGYRFTAPSGPLPQGIRAVQAPMIQNATAEPSTSPALESNAVRVSTFAVKVTLRGSPRIVPIAAM